MNGSKYGVGTQYHYSIRRLAVGVASVAVGCSLAGGRLVFAQELPAPITESTTNVEEAATPVLFSEENVSGVNKGEASEILPEREGSTPVDNRTEEDRAAVVPVHSEGETGESPLPLSSLPPAERMENLDLPAGSLGAITSFTFDKGRASIRYATGEQARVDLYNDHVFRYSVEKNGEFREHPEPSDPNRPAVITVKSVTDYQKEQPTPGRLIEEESRYVLETDKVWLMFDKATSRLSIFDRLANRFVTKEAAPLTLSTDAAVQTLTQEADEYFFGGGMQNGRFSHKGTKINIVNENNWVDGGVASPNPFYWSNKGYGVLRHTFRPGVYDFGSEHKHQVTTRHTEPRFDAFYFVNSKPEAIIKDYQELTGKPVVLPEYALYLGHLNAYNRDFWIEVPEGTPGAILLDGKWYKEFQPQHLPADQREKAVRETLNGEGESYRFSARAVIDRYKAQDMPLSWFLPNDGYGAGYGQADSLDGNIANLKRFVDYAKERGIKVGLWTQSDLEDTSPSKDVVLHRHIDKEVADAGIRAIKTDVAWVGPGYSFGLNGVDEGAKRLTEKSGSEQARPFIVSLDGWGGTQRSAAIWSGDQAGGEWEYIRFHIPTYIGLGLSGNPNMGSDMDGIFGGANAIINARDYQWKMFTSLMMNMDGWGSKPKNPFAFDERTTDINRMSLKKKSTLLPYAYSIGHEARETGKPIVRAMLIDFPDEVAHYTKDVQYQYMYGSNFLVAPIYQNTAMAENGDDIRHGIFLPAKEEWIDWYTGRKYQGGQVLNGFESPLWKAPVFVRNGAIVPITEPHNNPSEVDRSKRLIQFYPHQESRFTLVEDDGTSVGYTRGELAKTVIESRAGDSNTKGDVRLTIHESQGTFKGFKKDKTTELHVAASQDVDGVEARVGGRLVSLRRVNSLADYQAGTNVYFFHQDSLVDTYNPRSQAIKDLAVAGTNFLKIKLEATDVTKEAIEVAITGFVNQFETPAQPEGISLPSTPAGLAAPEATISSTSIGLNWQEVAGATSYEIERDGLLYTGITSPHFAFNQFEFGSSHTFKVRAVNAKGKSDWSTPLTVSTHADPWADAIEGIQATTTIATQGGQGLEHLFDKQLGGQFHSRWNEAVSFPATIQMDLGGVYQVDRIEYYPRSDNGANGRITSVYFEVSEDGVNWISDQYYTNWANDNKKKVYRVTAPRSRYIRMHVGAGVNQFVSGEELLVFKKPGSRMAVPGDISNDGRISEDDKTSFLNYSGLRGQDSDFDYIRHADSNKNDVIDAYDISLAATRLNGGVTRPSSVPPSGNLYMAADKLTLAAGDETTLRLMASDFSAVNALTSTFTIQGDELEVLESIEGNAAFTKQAENFSSVVRTRGTETNLVFSFVNFGQQELLSGSGEVARLRVRAKRALTLAGQSQDGLLVGNDLRVQPVANKVVRKHVNYQSVPAAPRQLVAKRVTPASLTLSWQEEPQALSYRIEAEQNGTFVEVASSDDATVTLHSLLPDHRYRLRVRAINPLGASAYSSILEVNTPVKDLSRKIAIVSARASVADQAGEELTKLTDGDETTLYHSDWSNRQAVPSELVVDLGKETAVDYLLYLPRTNAGNGTITLMSLAISSDGEEWQAVSDPIHWEVSNTEKVALFPEGTKTRYIKINWLGSVGGYISGNELMVIAPENLAPTVEEESAPSTKPSEETEELQKSPASPQSPASPLVPDSEGASEETSQPVNVSTEREDSPVSPDLSLLMKEGYPSVTLGQLAGDRQGLPRMQDATPPRKQADLLSSPSTVSHSFDESVPSATSSAQPLTRQTSDTSSILPETGGQNSVHLTVLGLLSLTALVQCRRVNRKSKTE